MHEFVDKYVSITITICLCGVLYGDVEFCNHFKIFVSTVQLDFSRMCIWSALQYECMLWKFCGIFSCKTFLQLLNCYVYLTMLSMIILMTFPPTFLSYMTRQFGWRATSTGSLIGKWKNCNKQVKCDCRNLWCMNIFKQILFEKKTRINLQNCVESTIV